MSHIYMLYENLSMLLCCSSMSTSCWSAVFLRRLGALRNDDGVVDAAIFVVQLLGLT